MEEKPRYSRISDIIDLLLLMQSKLCGVTIADIQERFNVSRRTAERMKESILNIMPQVQEIEGTGRIKHWGFVNYSISEFVSFSGSEIATLKNLLNNSDNVTKNELSSVITKLEVLSKKYKRNLADDIEYILHSEGYAIRQTSNYKIDLVDLSIIREGIKGEFKISATYNGKEKLLSPLGLIYGEKIHLIAREEDKGQGEYNYLLHKLKDIKLTSEKFDKKDFDLKKFFKNSFGVYNGEVLDVKLQFDSSVKEDVINYNFHPSQKIKVESDGSVIVKFKASGDKQIMWNLFKWGNMVKILKPAKLRKEYKEYLESVLKGYKNGKR